MSARHFILAAAAALITGGGAQAHHSFAMYASQETVIVGTVKAFQWANPHSWVQVTAPDARGRLVEWAIEGGSPNTLARRGWRSDSIKAGDRVSVRIHPIRDGSNGGSLVNVTLADGTVLGARAKSAS